MEEDTKHIIDVNRDNLARIIGFVGVMDSKAAFVLTLVLALTAYLVSQLGPFLTAHVEHRAANAWAPVFFVLLDTLALACLCCFVADTLIIIHAIKPRTERHTGKHSPLFFDTIAMMPCEEFKDRMQNITPNQYIENLIDQAFDNAKIVRQKTASVQRSVTIFCWGLGFFFAFTIGRPILIALVGG